MVAIRAYAIHPCGAAFELWCGKKAVRSVAGHPLVVPTKAFAQALMEEWRQEKPAVRQNMPLLSLANTALDKVQGQEMQAVQEMLAYVDTDTLCYRSPDNDALFGKQQTRWDPLIAWTEQKFSCRIATTRGVMPVPGNPELQTAWQAYLRSLNAFQLVGFSVLAHCTGSLMLALAVHEKRLSANEAYGLSRLEEEVQREAWGEDEEAGARAKSIHQEMMHASRFLELLDVTRIPR